MRVPSITRTLEVLGALLLLVMGGIHLQLWSQAYHVIPVIGPLFVANAAAAVVVALAIVIRPHPLVLAAGVFLALGTFAGFLISVNYGLFGFTDTAAAPLAIPAAVTEIAATVMLLAALVLRLSSRGTANL